MSAKYRLPCSYIWPKLTMQQSHDLFATAKLFVSKFKYVIDNKACQFVSFYMPLNRLRLGLDYSNFLPRCRVRIGNRKSVCLSVHLSNA